jgi:hypothetical protein
MSGQNLRLEGFVVFNIIESLLNKSPMIVLRLLFLIQRDWVCVHTIIH